jgi:hypothetical protein
MDAAASGDLHRTKRPQRTAKSCGHDAATLASSWREYRADDGGKRGRSPGRARISRKTIARGKPGCPGCTCSLTRVHFCSTLRTRDCGRSRRPAFPAPSRRREGQRDCTTRANHAAGMRAHVPPPSLRAKRSNPTLPRQRKLDCFVAIAPRNDGAGDFKKPSQACACAGRLEQPAPPGARTACP